MLLRNLHARHCLADGSYELQCLQGKNVGTAVSCSPVIRVPLYYSCTESAPIKTAIGALSTRCMKTIDGFYNVPDTDTENDRSS
jgi:hypothetical protein